MLSADMFPNPRYGVRARWAPLILEPIAGSPERLVVGCAVVNEGGVHIEFANALDRLRCLYGDQSSPLLTALKFAEHSLREDFSERGARALFEHQLPLSGLHFGAIREGEGADLRDIASAWLGVLSSLNDATKVSAVVEFKAAPVDVVAIEKKIVQPLPVSILAAVAAKKIELIQYFSDDLKEGRKKRRNFGSHEILIDYSGKRLVANFASLDATRLSPSVGNIKQRLWDLKVERDQNFRAGRVREHELIVRVPAAADIPVTGKAKANLQEAYRGLEQQADNEDLRLIPLASAEEIGDHIMQREAA